tara:strand:+ start:42 stop:185 length:144 start_codon:yes stop_codon:yes gene_type:complete
MAVKVNKASKSTRSKNVLKKARAEEIRKAKLVKTHKPQEVNKKKKKK